jgi:tetratricopeptide (TPR) repeat protein
MHDLPQAVPRPPRRRGAHRSWLTLCCAAWLVPAALGANDSQRSPRAAAKPPAVEKKRSPAHDEYLKINYIFNRELYELAIPRYRKLLEDHPGFADKAMVDYALAVCHSSLASKPEGQSRGTAGRPPATGADAAEGTRRVHLEEAVKHLQAALADRRFEEREAALRLLARCQLGLGDAVAAAKQFQALLEHQKGPERAETAMGLADAHYHGGAYAAAAQAYELAISILEGNPGSALERARFYRAMALYKEDGDAAAAARPLFEELARGRGELAFDARYMAAVASQKDGDLEEALAGYEALAASDIPSWREAGLYGMGTVLFQLGRHDAAAARLGDLLTTFPQTRHRGSATLYRGRALIEKGDLNTGARMLFELRKSPEVGGEAALWLARAYSSRGRHASAVKLLQSAENVADGRLRELLDLELAIELLADGQLEAAAQALDAFLGRHAGSESVDHVLYLKAYVLHRSGKLEESALACARFLEAFPRSRFRGDVRQLQAENLFLAGKYGEAASSFQAYEEEHAADLDPAKLLLARYRRAEAFFLEGRYREALELLEGLARGPTREALENAPGVEKIRESFRYLLGDCSYQLKDYARAALELKAYLASAKDATRASDARFKLAHALQLTGDLEAAHAAYRAALEADPQSPHRQQIQFELAQCAFQEKDYAGAAALFESIAGTAAPSRFTAHAFRFLGWIAQHRGRHDEAASWYRKLLEGFPGHELEAEALFGLATSLKAAKRFDEAQKAFRELREKHPDDARLERARLEEGIALAREKRPEEALEVFATLRAERLSPDLAALFVYETAWCHRLKGDVEKAAAAYRELIVLPPGSGAQVSELAGSARLELAELEFDRERYRPAIELLGPLASGPPAAEQGGAGLYERALYRLAWCHYRLGEPKPLETAFESLQRHHPSSELLPEIALIVARSHLEQKDAAKAGRIFRLILEQKPEPKEAELALVSYAECLNEERRFEEARDALLRFLEKHPSSAHAVRAHFGLGWARENLGRLDEAVESYRLAAAGASVTSARAQFQIGQCLAAAEKYEDAVFEFLQVPARYGFREWSARALLQAGGCFEALDSPERARKHYQEVLDEHPASEEAALAKERLAQLAASR